MFEFEKCLLRQFFSRAISDAIVISVCVFPMLALYKREGFTKTSSPMLSTMTDIKLSSNILPHVWPRYQHSFAVSPKHSKQYVHVDDMKYTYTCHTKCKAAPSVLGNSACFRSVQTSSSFRIEIIAGPPRIASERRFLPVCYTSVSSIIVMNS
jgi:hypothetical protein